VGFDVLTTCQPSTVWCSRERLPAAAAQPAKVRQICSATDYYVTHPLRMTDTDRQNSAAISCPVSPCFAIRYLYYNQSIELWWMNQE
jgi:hypothetical protein